MKAITVFACILQNKNMLCSTPAVYKIIYKPRDPKLCMILHMWSDQDRASESISLCNLDARINAV